MDTLRIPNTDLDASRIGYGCVGLADWSSAPLSTDDVKHASQIVDAALENGINLFDHANVYALGRSEAVFGQILKETPNLRDKVIIQSKCGQLFPEGWERGDPIRSDLSAGAIQDSVEGSLTRLGIDRLDILLLHLPDALADFGEVAAELDRLHAQGKVGHFGVSNFNASQIELLRRQVRQPIVINQVHLSLGHPDLILDGYEFPLAIHAGSAKLASGSYARTGTGGTLDYCRLHDIQVQAWSPLRLDLLNASSSDDPAIRKTSELLATAAERRGTTVPAILLAWILRHPAQIMPVIGSKNVAHIADNCTAVRAQLDRDEWYDLLASATNLEPRLIAS